MRPVHHHLPSRPRRRAADLPTAWRCSKTSTTCSRCTRTWRSRTRSWPSSVEHDTDHRRRPGLPVHRIRHRRLPTACASSTSPAGSCAAKRRRLVRTGCGAIFDGLGTVIDTHAPRELRDREGVPASQPLFRAEARAGAEGVAILAGCAALAGGARVLAERDQAGGDREGARVEGADPVHDEGYCSSLREPPQTDRGGRAGGGDLSRAHLRTTHGAARAHDGERRRRRLPMIAWMHGVLREKHPPLLLVDTGGVSATRWRRR